MCGLSDSGLMLLLFPSFHICCWSFRFFRRFCFIWFLNFLLGFCVAFFAFFIFLFFFPFLFVRSFSFVYFVFLFAAWGVSLCFFFFLSFFFCLCALFGSFLLRDSFFPACFFLSLSFVLFFFLFVCVFVCVRGGRLCQAVVILGSQKTLPVALSVVSYLPETIADPGLMVVACIVAHIVQVRRRRRSLERHSSPFCPTRCSSTRCSCHAGCCPRRRHRALRRRPRRRPLWWTCSLTPWWSRTQMPCRSRWRLARASTARSSGAQREVAVRTHIRLLCQFRPDIVYYNYFITTTTK